MPLHHASFSVSDFEKSRHFYNQALAPLGYKVLMEVSRQGTEVIDVVGYGVPPIPEFWILAGEAPKSAIHLAFPAQSPEQIQAFYAAALAAGGRDNGAPGPRPHYHAKYYAAFVYDPDGNNIEAVLQT